MKHFVIHTMMFGLLLTACVGQSARAQSQGEPGFAVAAQNSGDEITLQYKENTTIIRINSPSGIGSAQFTLESGKMPEQIIVQLHLKGLEEFRLISEQNIVAASVLSSKGIQSQSQGKISGNSEEPIQSSDPLWLKIEIISKSKEIPLEDGYFEIVLPMQFVKQSGSSFEIHWIDFFR